MRFLVEYDGAAFSGWQAQAVERSVQGDLERSLDALGPHGRVTAAGRTDAGVHALAMPAHVDLASRLNAEALRRAINARLAVDARIFALHDAPDDWHARFSCLWRAYRYDLLLTPEPSPLRRGRALWWPRPLDLASMREAAAALVGRHDFASFATQEERATVREVYSLGVRAAPEGVSILVAGESFLRRMVRGLVGTLLLAGEGRLDPRSVSGIIGARDRALAGPNVPPRGLYFVAGGYGPYPGERVFEAPPRWWPEGEGV